MLVSLVGALKVGHQFSQRAVSQRFVHQVGAPAHAQRPVAPVAVNAQNHVVEAVSGELGFKADGETLERRQPVGQVADQHQGVKERSGRSSLFLVLYYFQCVRSCHKIRCIVGHVVYGQRASVKRHVRV